jgi:hypothetical protein
MHCEVSTQQPEADKDPHHFGKWSGLHAHMTLSYVWVTIGLVLIFMALAWLAFVGVATTFVAPLVYTLSAHDLAGRYAFAATLQADASGLNPNATFQPQRTNSLSLPGTSAASDGVQVAYLGTLHPATQRLAFVLLITPQSRVLASGYR